MTVSLLQLTLLSIPFRKIVFSDHTVEIASISIPQVLDLQTPESKVVRPHFILENLKLEANSVGPGCAKLRGKMPDYETFDLGDFKLQNGETIPGAFIG